MKKQSAVVLISLGLLCLPSNVLAAPKQASPASAKVQSPAPGAIYSAMNIQTLESIMKAEGYSVSIDKDGDIIWKIEGLTAALMIDKEGESLLFQISFTDSKATLQHVNAWNKNKRYSRSYIADDDRVVLELDLGLEGGVSKARVIDYLKTCRVSLGSWAQEVVVAE